MRVKFNKGKQREFLDLVINKLNCLSLRRLLQFGLKTDYSCLKNYYNERRTLPLELFNDICYLAKLNKNDFNVIFLRDNWGKIKGGKFKKS